MFCWKEPWVVGAALDESTLFGGFPARRRRGGSCLSGLGTPDGYLEFDNVGTDPSIRPPVPWFVDYGTQGFPSIVSFGGGYIPCSFSLF